MFQVFHKVTPPPNNNNDRIEDIRLHFPIDLCLTRSLSVFLALDLFYIFYYCAIVFVVISPTKATFSKVCIKERFLDKFSAQVDMTHGLYVELSSQSSYQGVGGLASSSGSCHYHYDSGQVTSSLNLTLLNCKMGMVNRIIKLLISHRS